MILVVFCEGVSSKAMRCTLSIICSPAPRTFSAWGTGGTVKLLGIIHSVVTGVSNLERLDKAERLNHPDDS